MRLWKVIEARAVTYKEHQKPANKDEVIKLYNGGVKQIDIANQLGYSKGTISGIIGKFCPHDIRKPADRTLVLNLWKEGKTKIEIGKLLGYNRSTISRIIKNIA